jgi:hypothetical protein
MTVTLFLLIALLGPSLAAQERVNPGAARIEDFEKRVAEYIKIRKSLESDLPRLKPTDSPGVIRDRERELARRIREARRTARRGDIFTPEIGAEFRRLIGLAMRAPSKERIRKSLQRAEPVALQLQVNQEYPAGVPLQSTPPTLLMNLPKLPQELDYRMAGRDLVLRDTQANLVVDLLPGVIL